MPPCWMALKKLHGWSAWLLMTFALLHLVNHLIGLAGVEAHIAVMSSLREVYRVPVVETVLLASVALQACSGLLLVVRGWRQRRGLVPWMQAGSGTYLAFFLLNHVGAVMYGRMVMNLDTNIHFAAAGFFAHPFQFFFAPYYFLAVWMLFIHLGCAAYWRVQDRSELVRVLAVGLPAGMGLAISLLILLVLSGTLHPFNVPAKYLAVFGAHR